MDPTNATFEPQERLIPNPKLRLRAQVAEVCRFRHMSLRTEDTYWQWIRRYIFFHNKRHPRELGAPEIQQFLSHLAVHDHVAAGTQNQALNALVFYTTRFSGTIPGASDRSSGHRIGGECPWCSAARRSAVCSRPWKGRCA